MTIAPAPRIEQVDTVAATFGTDREQMSFLFVRIATDDGTVGWGEVCDSYGCSYAPVLAVTIEVVFAPLLVGRTVDVVEPRTEAIRLA
ncbi:MAG: hypothetical protein ACLGHQ_13870, partial [Acidimicrobiia bacterium]